MDTYQKVQIFDNNELDTLKSVYSSLPSVTFFQYHNLFNVEYSVADRYIHPLNSLNEYVKQISNDNLEIHSSYFLKYTPGSFARLHPDHQSKLTVVTLLESNDLVGGDTILSLPYKRRPRPADQQCRRSGKENKQPPYGQNIVQRVVTVEDGQSLVYGNKLIHGVTEVEQGSRVVFVNWYR